MNLLPLSGKNYLFLTIDAIDKTIEYNKILRNISRDKLVSTIPASWVTKYEKLRAYPQRLNPIDDYNHYYPLGNRIGM